MLEEPVETILINPDALAKADPNVKPGGKKTGIHTVREVYTRKPDDGFRDILKKQLKELGKKNRLHEEVHGTDLDSMMILDPKPFVAKRKMSTKQAVTEILAGLAKGGNVGESKIPNIPTKPARLDVGSRLSRAGWHTSQKVAGPEINRFDEKPAEIKTINPLDVLKRWQGASPKSTVAPTAKK